MMSSVHVPTRILPQGDLDPAGPDGGNGSWAVTGERPRFELVSSTALRPGAYEIRLRLKPEGSLGSLAEAKISFDNGHDFEGKTPLDFRPAGRSGLLTAEFLLHEAIERFRLDLKVGSNVRAISDIRLLRRSMTLRRISRALLGRVWAPSDALRLAGKSLRILANGGVPALKAAVAASFAARDPVRAQRYASWVSLYDTLTAERLAKIRKQVACLQRKPLISVIVPTYNTPRDLLVAMIESVRAQVYEDWELCIADDSSTAPHVHEVLARYASDDPRIRFVIREQNGHISHATNSAMELVRGEWVALLDHDDILSAHALAEVALEIARHPDAELIYSDEDKIDASGQRCHPFFKPDFSREFLRSQNYLNHLTVHRAANIRAVGGWRPGFEGSQDYDLNLRIIEQIDETKIRHIRKVLYHWRAVEGSTAVSGSEKSYAYSAGFRALEDHVKRMGLDAEVLEVPGLPFYRMRYNLPTPVPLVSLIIPTRDGVEYLRNCIASIREKTTYPRYEIIVVDNGSQKPETLGYLEALAQQDNTHVLRYDKPFNYSAINNFAVAHARGNIIGLVNDDVEVITPDWLTEMVSFAVQPEIGCVGAKLYYADGRIQHAGVVLGLGGVAGHAHRLLDKRHPGYFGKAAVSQNLLAVTAACLVVRKSVYEAVGGLNEEALAVAFNDVDFCLKVNALGLRNVFTPFAELFHLESVSRGPEDSPEKIARFAAEMNYMQRTWPAEIACDRFYSPNLSLDQPSYELAFPPRS